jgi:uncharacterized protein (TIGR00251 family)
MRVYVIAKPNAKNEKVEQIDETHFKIAVKEPPRDGKANEAITKALAGFLKIPSVRVFLQSGFSSKTKVFKII